MMSAATAKEPTIGYTHQCPHCKSRDTYYSSLHEAWVCLNPNCMNEFSIDIALADEYEEYYD